MEDLLVTVRGLTRRYRLGKSEVTAVAGVDLDLRQGEFLAVVGVSGSGKSTLLHLVGGLDTPTSGSIQVAGRMLHTMSPFELALFRRRTVGFIFQSFHLVPSMTAEANVALALTIQGTYGEPRRRLAAEALCRVGLEKRARHRPSELSGGEQQRVAVARAIVHRPPLLLADEPTGNLDHKTAADVVALLRDLSREQGTAVVLVTHDQELATRYADRMIRLVDGLIVEQVAMV
jgi:ABC-type lipoprotein export system ATPase subunit